MRIRIVGAGAVGMLMAGCLTRSGQPVELVVRTPDQQGRLAAEGLSVERQSGGPFVERIASLTFEEWTAGRRAEAEDEWIFLTVKQNAVTADFVRLLASRMGERDKLLCFQNGIGHEEILISLIPPDRLYFAVTTEAAKKVSAREVSHTGSGLTYVGQIDKQGMLENTEGDLANETSALIKVMQRAGFRTEAANDMKSRIWSKLMVNAVINPLTALLEVPNGVLLSSGHHMELMKSLFQDACEIARWNQVELQSGLWEHLLKVCADTAVNRSSMLQDILHNRQTEIEWIQGGLIRHADRLGLAVPALRTVYRLLKAKEENLGRDL